MTKALLLLPFMTGFFLTSQASGVSPQAQQAAAAARELAGAIRNCDMSWIVDRMYPPIKAYYANKLALRSQDAKRNSIRQMKEGTRETSAQLRAREQANIRALRAQYVKQGQLLKSKGVLIERFTVSEPHVEYVLSPPVNVVTGVLKDGQARRQADNLEEGGDRSRLVVLPTTLILRIPLPRGGTVRMEQRSFIYAVRDEIVSSSQQGDTKPNTWYFIDAKTSVGTLRAFFPDLPSQISLPPTSERRLSP